MTHFHRAISAKAQSNQAEQVRRLLALVLQEQLRKFLPKSGNLGPVTDQM